MTTLLFKPLIIIGAPRSGTNMLRDVLVQLTGVETWPCDEINYIWRHGNMRYSSDVFPSELATPRTKKFIRNEFKKIAAQFKATHVLEKTCANSLRVDFVDRILPEAKYIFIVRDGLDVIASAMRRWQATLDIPYILRKARYIPLTDLPYYAICYLRNRYHLLVSKEKRLAYWGPTLDNMDLLLANHSLEQICAIQWKKCVDSATVSFEKMPAGKVHKVRYEDFVINPKAEMKKIYYFLDIQVSEKTEKTILQNVSSKSVGKGFAELNRNGLTEKIVPFIQETLSRHGYFSG